MKNILFVHQSAELYGSDKVLLYLVTQLMSRGDFYPIVVLPEKGALAAALVDSGVEVHIADVLKVGRSTFSIKGVLNLLLRLRPAFVGLDRILQGRQIDLVHSNTLAVFSGALWAYFRRKGHVWHVHELILSPLLVARSYALLLWLFADKVICNSSATRNWLLSHCVRLRAKSCVVFNGQPVAARPVPSANPLATLGLPVGESTVISLVGRINRWKGHLLLVEAARLLNERGRLGGVCFLIVGDPPPSELHHLDALRARIQDYGLADQFRISGFIEDIAAVWSVTDIAVVPSTEPEPFGMVAVEAMSHGLPVVAAGHGGLVDIVVDGETGLLFEPGSAVSLADALGRLLSDSQLRLDYGRRGLSHQAELFSMDRQFRAISSIYMEMVE